jgi:hypothetical protein
LEGVHESWTWDPKKSDLEYSLACLKCFVKTEGHARVPASYKLKDGYRLGLFVVNRRQDYRKNKLDADTIALLEAVHGTWSWDLNESKFEENLFTLKKFVRDQGHARPGDNTKFENFALGRWVRHQRSAYRQGRLNPEKVRELEGVHTTWTWGDRRK